MTQSRPQRLATAIRKIVAPFLRSCPQECGMVSIANVEMSDDLGVATIFLTALSQPDAAVIFFTEQQSRIRSKLSMLALRRVPELRFKIDEGYLNAERMEQVLL